MTDLELVRELFDYDPDTGALTWRVIRGKRGLTAAGTINKGYRCVFIGPKKYAVHRIAWLMVHGEWPKGHIDHIDGDPLNNRMANLRDVSRAVNIQNQRRPHKDSSTGVLGVAKNKQGRFTAQIGLNGKQIYLGAFSTKEEAHQAYLAAKRVHHEGAVI